MIKESNLRTFDFVQLHKDHPEIPANAGDAPLNNS